MFYLYLLVFIVYLCFYYQEILRDIVLFIFVYSLLCRDRKYLVCKMNVEIIFGQKYGYFLFVGFFFFIIGLECNCQ